VDVNGQILVASGRALCFLGAGSAAFGATDIGLFVRLEAKPGKEKEVADFLKQALQMANQEKTTPLWFALRLGPSTFAVSDAFHDDSGRQAHLNGPIAKALFANASTLLAAPPSIEKTEILGAKISQEVQKAA